jgi:aryl carrier-like protein
MLGGEPFTEADVADWFAEKEMINTYGPAECSIRATITNAIRGIGVGYGMNTWIVTLDGSDRLSPMGAIGELWLEGPLVGRGYLGNEAITASAFVTRANWVRPNETSRFYRTGDLVRYEPNGHLMCVGRKDFQVKIRGQRTELGEVEHNIQTSFLAVGLEPQLMADVFKPRGSDNVILVAFFKCSNREDARRRFAALEELLPKMMPEYMIPTVFVGLDAFPMTSNGKTDRKSLRSTYANITLEQLISNDIRHGSNYCPPSSASEKLLRDLWAETLNINADAISVDSGFFRIGGDSLGAMRLVSAARQRGAVFSVADVFQNPRLSSLANVLHYQDASQYPIDLDVEPFSLTTDQLYLEEIKAHAARICGVEPEDIEDILPCTPLQEGLVAESVQGRGDNMLTETRTLIKGIESNRLLNAWAHVVQTHPILRTRFIDTPSQGLAQVVVRSERCGFQERLSERQFNLGMSLFYCTVSSTSTTWSIHHALYDGRSWPLIMSSLSKAYLDQSIDCTTPFRSFVKYVKSVNYTQAERFWKEQFRDSEAQNFPPLPSKSYTSSCDSQLVRDINGLVWDGDSTAATKIRLAWAILVSAATHSSDVLFGTTVSGRQAPIPGIDNISGPTFATVPLRIQLDPTATVETLLQQVQLQAVHIIPFEQVGLQQIQRINDDCKYGCQFQS